MEGRGSRARSAAHMGVMTIQELTRPLLRRTEATRSRITYTAVIDQNVSADFTFILPRAERTCPTGTEQAIPVVGVRRVIGGATEPWIDGDDLPEATNSMIQTALQAAIVREHRIAVQAGTLPVSVATVERFHLTDGAATVTDIRNAAQVADKMAGEDFASADSMALWIARNFVDSEDHGRQVAILQEKIDDQDDAVCECDPPINPQQQAQLEAIETLRVHGERVLQFRPGTTVVDQLLDLIDDVGR